MQYQSQFSEAEPQPVRPSRPVAAGEDLRDPFGRTLEVARDQDRARHIVRRRNFVRRLASSNTLYHRLYNAVVVVGLGGALGGLAVPIYGYIAWAWPMPGTAMIFTYALALGIFVCVLERGARSLTRFTVSWIRRMAQAEGIELDTPAEPWPLLTSPRSRSFRIRARLRQ